MKKKAIKDIRREKRAELPPMARERAKEASAAWKEAELPTE
jgi:hypothetical protein